MRHKLIVSKWHANVFEQLLDAWVGHLVVLRRDKDARRRNQCHNLVLGLAAEVRNAQNVLPNVIHLQVGIIG